MASQNDYTYEPLISEKRNRNRNPSILKILILAFLVIFVCGLVALGFTQFVVHFLSNHYEVTDPSTTPLPSTEIVGPTSNSSCAPQSNHTFLFAYSNDLDPQIVKQSIHMVVGSSVTGNYSKFGTIRFDTKDSGSFQFFNDLKSLNQSVYSNLPDPSLGFSNNQTGSDILNILERFLENTNGVPLCGSQVVILLKRHPLESDTSDLLAHLQYHHIFINTAMSNTPILGENHQVMYDLSGLTNGVAGFSDDQDMHHEIWGFSAVLGFPFQIYSINPICKSGIERTDLPVLQIPQSGSSIVRSWIEISVQDHAPLDKFRSLNLTLTNTLNPDDQINFSQDDTWFDSTNVFWNFPTIQGASYSVRLLLDYSDAVPENLQIRIWTRDAAPIDFWQPFRNWN